MHSKDRRAGREGGGRGAPPIDSGAKTDAHTSEVSGSQRAPGSSAAPGTSSAVHSAWKTHLNHRARRDEKRFSDARTQVSTINRSTSITGCAGGAAVSVRDARITAARRPPQRGSDTV